MSLGHGSSIVRDGLVLHLDAANVKSYSGSGAIWKDLSGNGNNGTLVNGVGYSSNYSGGLIFDGVNDYISIARPAQIVTGGSISVECWAKWISIGTTTGTIQVLVDNNHSSSPRQGFVLQDRPDLNKKLTWTVYPNSNGVTSTTQIGNGQWRHIVGTNNGSISKLYIDGVLDGELYEPGLAAVQPTISIGYWQFSSPRRYLTGSITNIQIYDHALTAIEIQQNFNALRGRYGI